MIDLNAEYPGKVEAPDANYPLGGAKNETAPGNFDGTPFEKAVFNDVLGQQQALLKMASIVASGNSDSALNKTASQQLQAILHMVIGASTFDESGIVDAYVLDVVDNNPAPANYSSNMNVVFVPGNTNTGASTVNVEGLGIVDIRLGGVALTGGELIAGVRYTIIYDSVNAWFELIVTEGKLVQTVDSPDGALATGTTVIPVDDTIPQNNEGDEYMTRSITPQSATNILEITVLAQMGWNNLRGNMTVALFQDATANALKAVGQFQKATGDGMSPVALVHYMIAGTVVSTTFKVRAGVENAGTTTFNGDGGTRKYGGVSGSNIIIKEYRP